MSQKKEPMPEQEELKTEELEQAEQAEAQENEGAKAEPKEPEIVSIASDELEKLKEEAADFKDKYWRLLAESENSRKRLIKERQETTKYAIKNLLLEFLNPLDNMDNALGFTDQMSEDVKAWAAGFQMILTQFKDVLQSQDIHSYDSMNQDFDPHLHEAVELVESDEHEEGLILQEFVKGYKMGDMVIRPARVKVTKKPVEPEAAAEPTPEAEEAAEGTSEE